MPARVSQVTMFAMLTWSLLAAGTRTATAQALCPKSDVRDFSEGFPRVPSTITVEADFRAFGGTLPGGAWRMPGSGGLAGDGLALEGVSFTRNAKAEQGSSGHTFDVVVDLRASDRILVDLEFVVVDGERRLRLGAFTGIAIRCEAKSVSQTFSISDRDFLSFFAGGKAPTLRVTRTGLVDGC
jgi:hypothetical protein